MTEAQVSKWLQGFEWGPTFQTPQQRQYIVFSICGPRVSFILHDWSAHHEHGGQTQSVCWKVCHQTLIPSITRHNLLFYKNCREVTEKGIVLAVVFKIMNDLYAWVNTVYVFLYDWTMNSDRLDNAGTMTHTASHLICYITVSSHDRTLWIIVVQQ